MKFSVSLRAVALSILPLTLLGCSPTSGQDCTAGGNISAQDSVQKFLEAVQLNDRGQASEMLPLGYSIPDGPWEKLRESLNQENLADLRFEENHLGPAEGPQTSERVSLADGSLLDYFQVLQPEDNSKCFVVTWGTKPQQSGNPTTPTASTDKMS